jgi:transcriptional regulator with GAF, ATPase, and Fis domain
MASVQANPFNKKNLVAQVLEEWQGLINVVAEIFGVPAGLVTRVDGKHIEILLSSKTEGNPYSAGYTTQFPDSGWYCERTLKNRDLLLIPNALKDPEWKDNPAAAGMHMISYVGVPIARPDGEMFGTMCYIDCKENAHNDVHVKLLNQVKLIIEQSLRIVLYKGEIADRDRLFDDLSKIYPMCSYCRKIRDAAGTWVVVEEYVNAISGREASHGICPVCLDRKPWRNSPSRS